MSALLRAAPIIALWGWSALALAASASPVVVGGVVAAFVASVLARRAPRVTAVVEIVALAAVVAVAPGRAAGFVATGALLVIGARAMSEVVRRRADGPVSS